MLRGMQSRCGGCVVAHVRTRVSSKNGVTECSTRSSLRLSLCPGPGRGIATGLWMGNKHTRASNAVALPLQVLPASLGKLQRLKTLNVDNNQVTAVPSEVGGSGPWHMVLRPSPLKQSATSLLGVP